MAFSSMAFPGNCPHHRINLSFYCFMTFSKGIHQTLLIKKKKRFFLFGHLVTRFFIPTPWGLTSRNSNHIIFATRTCNERINMELYRSILDGFVIKNDLRGGFIKTDFVLELYSTRLAWLSVCPWKS